MVILLKVWSFLKKHWYIPLVAVLAIVAFGIMGRRGAEPLMRVIKRQRQAHREEVARIDAAEAKKEAKQRDAIEEHRETKKEIEAEHERRLEEIDDEVDREWDELNRLDSKKLTDRVADEFGFEVHDVE